MFSKWRTELSGISLFDDDDDLVRLLERRPDESGEMVELINNQCSPR